MQKGPCQSWGRGIGISDHQGLPAKPTPRKTIAAVSLQGTVGGTQPSRSCSSNYSLQTGREAAATMCHTERIGSLVEGCNQIQSSINI